MSTHMDNIRRMAELEAERDAALEQVIYWRERAVDAEAERDALAAHIGRIAGYKDRLEAKGLMPARLAGVIEEAPATSLARMRDERAQAIQQAVKQARREWAREDADAIARLKAQWQAEAMQATADAIRYEYEGEVHRDRIADYADDMADELRRQAEEATHD